MSDLRTSLDRLQLAIEAEQKETAAKQSSYESLIKITNFQLGAGPPPSVEDFLHWQVEAAERERQRVLDEARTGLPQRHARASPASRAQR